MGRVPRRQVHRPDKIPPPSFWRELRHAAAHQLVEPFVNLGFGMYAALKHHAAHTQQIMDDAHERGLPMNPIGASMAAAVTDTVEGINDDIAKCKEEVEKALEAETKADAALHAFEATWNMGKAAMGAATLAEPIAGFGEAAGGAAAGGGMSMGMALVDDASAQVESSATRGGTAERPRPTGELNTLTEGGEAERAATTEAAQAESAAAHELEPATTPRRNTTRTGHKRNNPAEWRRLRDSWDAAGYGKALSEENRARIAAGRTPIVDEAWVEYFPGDKQYMGEAISMHHIGGNSLTVPLPKSRHMDAHMPGGTAKNPGGPGVTGSLEVTSDQRLA